MTPSAAASGRVTARGQVMPRGTSSRSGVLGRASLPALALAASLCAALTCAARPQAGGGGARMKQSACVVAGLKFPCPEGFAKSVEASGEEWAFMRHGEYELAVFVAAPAASSDAGGFEDELPALVARKLYADDGARPYRWKHMKAPAKLSRSEAGSVAKQGFNGRWRVFVEFHRLTLGGRVVYVGHVYGSRGRGNQREAERLFELGAEAGSVVSECAAQDVVGALTGEKVDPRGTLCELMVRPGRGPRALPKVRVRPVRPPGR